MSKSRLSVKRRLPRRGSMRQGRLKRWSRRAGNRCNGGPRKRRRHSSSFRSRSVFCRHSASVPKRPKSRFPYRRLYLLPQAAEALSKRALCKSRRSQSVRWLRKRKRLLPRQEENRRLSPQQNPRRIHGRFYRLHNSQRFWGLRLFCQIFCNLFPLLQKRI